MQYDLPLRARIAHLWFAGISMPPHGSATQNGPLPANPEQDDRI